MNIISLMTDFGLKDGNVGVMKGVILGLAPHARVVDLSHEISPQNVAEAALILYRSALYFPPQSIHVIVVDPGVGTARRPIAAHIGEQYYICPDNGVLTLVMEHAEAQHWPMSFVHMDKPKFWRKEISHVFHGRDIFAPAAGHLAAHVPFSELGSIITDPVRLALPQPQPIPNGLRGEVIHIDHFGNVASNLRMEHLPPNPKAKVRLGSVEIDGLVHAFGERPAGELVALFGSTGSLIVSVVNGSAAARLGVKLGDPFEVILSNE